MNVNLFLLYFLLSQIFASKNLLRTEGWVCVENSYCKQLRGCSLTLLNEDFIHTVTHCHQTTAAHFQVRSSHVMLESISVLIQTSYMRRQLSETGAAMKRIHIHIYSAIIFTFLPCQIFTVAGGYKQGCKNYRERTT